jgi:hypothetical protein
MAIPVAIVQSNVGTTPSNATLQPASATMDEIDQLGRPKTPLASQLNQLAGNAQNATDSAYRAESLDLLRQMAKHSKDNVQATAEVVKNTIGI